MTYSIFRLKHVVAHRMRIGVIAIALLSACSMTHAEEKEELFASEARALIVRYDSDQVTLTTLMLDRLLNDPEARAKIGDKVSRVSVGWDESPAEQPLGVFAGSLWLNFKEKVEDEDALFESARKVLEDSLNERLFKTQRNDLAWMSEEVSTQIKVMRLELREHQKLLDETLVHGTPDRIRETLEEMRHRILESQIQSKLSSVRSELAERDFAELRGMKQALSKKVLEVESQIATALQDVKKLASKNEAEVDVLAKEYLEATKKLGAGHPKRVALKSQLETLLTQGKKGDEQSKERRALHSKLQSQLSELRTEQAEVAQRYSETAKSLGDQKSQKVVSELEDDILTEELDRISVAAKKTMKAAPNIQAAIEDASRELEGLYQTHSALQSKIRGLQKVSVEMW